MIQVDRNGIASVNVDYRDTVYDTLAAANRIGYANYRAICQLQNLLMFAFIMVGVYYLRRRSV